MSKSTKDDSLAAAEKSAQLSEDKQPEILQTEQKLILSGNEQQEDKMVVQKADSLAAAEEQPNDYTNKTQNTGLLKN